MNFVQIKEARLLELIMNLIFPCYYVICLRGAIGERVRLLTERLVVQAHPMSLFTTPALHLQAFYEKVGFCNRFFFSP